MKIILDYLLKRYYDIAKFREVFMENAIAIRPMIYKEARECADRIHLNMSNIRRDVVELHDRDGWGALGYKDWTECVQQEFKQAERYIFYQYKAARIEQNVTDCTNVQLGNIPEGQLRPLSKLEPAQQREAWQKAVETAPEGKVTAAHVSKVVKEITGEQPKTKPELKPTIPEHAVYFAQIAISQLERISDDDPTRDKALNMVENWIKQNRKGNKK